MFELLSASIEKAAVILGILGYPGVFFISLLDRLTVFLIPAEIVLPAFGILVSLGVLTFTKVLFWVTVGGFAGNMCLYFIFLKGGRPFLEKYGHYFLISKHELYHLDNWFSKYGDKIVIIGYLLPTSIRSVVPIPAGISKMNLAKFSFYTFICSLPYNFLLIFVGMKLADKLENIFRFFDKLNYYFMAAVIAFIVWYVYRHFKKKHLTHK